MQPNQIEPNQKSINKRKQQTKKTKKDNNNKTLVKYIRKAKQAVLIQQNNDNNINQDHARTYTNTWIFFNGMSMMFIHNSMTDQMKTIFKVNCNRNMFQQPTTQPTQAKKKRKQE